MGARHAGDVLTDAVARMARSYKGNSAGGRKQPSITPESRRLNGGFRQILPPDLTAPPVELFEKPLRPSL